MKLVYILSNHGGNKNYVKKTFNNGATFTRDKNKALRFGKEDAEVMKRTLVSSMGNAYIEEEKWDC